MLNINYAINELREEEEEEDQLEIAPQNRSRNSSRMLNSIFEKSIREPLLTQSEVARNDIRSRLKKKIGEGFANGDIRFFTSETCESKDFFKEIMYNVELSKLYKIVDTCFYSQGMPYCPILVENMQENAKTKYQLQVWDKRGKIVFQKDLNSELRAWCITNQILVFLPDKNDQRNDELCYYIVYLYRDNTVIKINVSSIDYIESIKKPVLGFCNKCLYLSDENKIYILNANGLQMNQTNDDFVDGRRQIKTIDLGPVKNHAFLIMWEKREQRLKIDRNFIIICCETADNQIDFAKLFFYPESPNLEYKIQQIGEMIERPKRRMNDPIIQFKVVYDNSRYQWPYAIALKQSGLIDFYWNYYLIESETSQLFENGVHFTDIEADFNNFYLLKDSESIFQVSLNTNGRIGLQEAKRVDMDSFFVKDFSELFQMRLINHVNFYSANCFVGTSLIVSHNNKVFIFDVSTNPVSLAKEFELDSPVIRFYRSQLSEGVYSVYVILESGYQILMNSDTHYMEANNWKMSQLTKYEFGIPVQFACNNQFPDSLFILSKKDNDVHRIWGIHKDKAFQVDQTIHNQIVLNEKSVLIAIQEGQKSHQRFGVLNETSNEAFQIQIVSCIHRLGKYMFEIDQSFNINIGSNGKDTIHSAVSLNLDEHIILFGRKHAYKYTAADGQTQCIENMRIASLQIVDDNYCYAIIQKNMKCTHTSYSGVKMFSMHTLLNKDRYHLFDIEPTIVARCNQINFSEDNQRIVYMKNFQSINIIPPLHRTTVSFIGMLPRERYLAVKKASNKFYAFDQNNNIMTWNAMTGKIIGKHQLENQDFSGFRIFGTEKKPRKDFTYAREWFQPKSLIFSNQEAKDGINTDLFDSMKPINYIKGCEAYVNQQENNIFLRTFKVIEINDEKSINEHITFVHQYFKDKSQKLYLSQDCDIMIEKLLNLRVIIYQKEKRLDQPSICKWRIVKRFSEFPHDLSDLSQKLYLFSPNLRRYANVAIFEDGSKALAIRETLSSNVLTSVKIPLVSELNQEEQLKDVVKRFMWVDNHQFIISSSWGFEKLFEIQGKEIVEINSSQIPSFQEISSAPHIYYEQPTLDKGQIQKRLLRKQQNLKRLRLISRSEEGIDIKQMYDVLFSVDFNVDHGEGKYLADLSFSYMQWNIIEYLTADSTSNKDILMIDECLLSQLCLNILPGCRSLLHLLKNKSQELGYIFSQVPVASEDFEMPFFKDLNKKTPLHYCIDNKDIKSADLMIRYLADAPLYHHSKEIQDILPQMIRQQPSLLEYFDKRKLTTPQLKEIDRGCIKTISKVMECGMVSSTVWDEIKKIRENLFLDQNGANDEQGYIEQECQLFLIDLPGFHQLDKQFCREFFNALKDANDLKLFDLQSIRLLIEFLWPRAKKVTQMKLLYPFVLFLAFYWLYTNIMEELKDQQENGFTMFLLPWMINLSILIAFSIYFLKNEYQQIEFQGMDYFRDPWNYIDLTPPVIVLVIAFINIFGIDTLWEATFKSCGSLLMWLKLLYFCRVNKHTGYLIRMIVKVLYGMRTFLSVLLITILAVADAFVSIKKDDESELGKAEAGQVNENFSLCGFISYRISQFFKAVYITYQMIIGGDGFEIREEYSVLASLLVIFCTLFVMIVMLNLLISIIGDIFGEVQQNQVNEGYQEKACIIAENSYLLPDDELMEQAGSRPGELLLVACKAGFDIQDTDDNTKADRDEKSKEELVKKIVSGVEKKIDILVRNRGNNADRNVTDLNQTSLLNQITNIRTTQIMSMMR